jgi:hypothetical protein
VTELFHKLLDAQRFKSPFNTLTGISDMSQAMDEAALALQVALADSDRDEKLIASWVSRLRTLLYSVDDVRDEFLGLTEPL